MLQLRFRTSIINATFIIIVTFVPLFFLSGMEGKLFGATRHNIHCFAFASLVVSITLTLLFWLLIYWPMKNVSTTTWWKLVGTAFAKWIFSCFESSNAQNSNFISVGLNAGNCNVTLSKLGRSFLPAPNSTRFLSYLGRHPTRAFHWKSNKIGSHVEQELLKIHRKSNDDSPHGRAELDEHAQKSQLRNRRSFCVWKTIVTRIPKTYGKSRQCIRRKHHYRTAHRTRIDHMLSGTRANIAIKVSGRIWQNCFRYLMISNEKFQVFRVWWI